MGVRRSTDARSATCAARPPEWWRRRRSARPRRMRSGGRTRAANHPASSQSRPPHELSNGHTGQRLSGAGTVSCQVKLSSQPPLCVRLGISLTSNAVRLTAIRAPLRTDPRTDLKRLLRHQHHLPCRGPNKDFEETHLCRRMDQRSALLLGGGTYKGESGLGTGIFPWTLLFGRSSVSFPTSPRCAVLGTCDTPSRSNLPDAALHRRQLEIQQSANSDAPRGPREPKNAFASAVYAQTKAEQAPAQQNRQGPHICRTDSSGLRLMRRTRGLCPCPQRAGRRRRGQS